MSLNKTVSEQSNIQVNFNAHVTNYAADSKILLLL